MMAQRAPRLRPDGVFAIFFLPVLLLMLFPAQLDGLIDKSTYLVFHNTAEFFSIMVSLAVFSVGWFTYDQSKDRHALFLGAAFLAVGLLDFMHTHEQRGHARLPDAQLHQQVDAVLDRRAAVPTPRRSWSAPLSTRTAGAGGCPRGSC